MSSERYGGEDPGALGSPTLASICEACFQDWCESCPSADLLGGSCCCGAWDSSNDEDEDELW